METFMNWAMVVEEMLLSFLLALWVTWMGLRGLFQLMPDTSRIAMPVRLAPARQSISKGSRIA